MESARLYESTSGLRPFLKDTARVGAITGWALLRKRLPTLPRLHRDGECVILWLVDEDRQAKEPPLAVLATVGNRQMHPCFPAVAEQLGLLCGTDTAQQTTSSYEVLKGHQYWHRLR
ncbi:hypothetical protein [Streptomyces griseomycini]|uniref:Uncharacterized protein n=1 Tax=Streptomyces griseomycini TaxID=66895 RepID=A0A7W7PYN3_9ACTN|nr:hypothetical protein [Streptomyces griseomycini]MBB4903742.1 hypothetical protein [Streptomyces griseomycini]